MARCLQRPQTVRSKVELAVEVSVATATLNRPEVTNAVNNEMRVPTGALPGDQIGANGASLMLRSGYRDSSSMSRYHAAAARLMTGSSSWTPR